METIEVARDDDRDLKFTGELVASASSRTTDGPTSNRWVELKLYRTQGGKLVCSRVGRTRWANETDRHNAAVCDSEAEAIEFFGHSDIAKYIYHDAGWDTTEKIE